MTVIAVVRNVALKSTRIPVITIVTIIQSTVAVVRLVPLVTNGTLIGIGPVLTIMTKWGLVGSLA
jgi:hypothetical protein